MNYIIYLSTSSHLLNQGELLEILNVSRANNTKRNLTGMLLYSEGTFIQLLEGDKEDLKRTYRSIELDDRHKSIIKMIEGESEERFFPEWSMGFKSANASELTEFKGYVNPTADGFLSGTDAKPLISMLKTFAENNRM